MSEAPCCASLSVHDFCPACEEESPTAVLCDLVDGHAGPHRDASGKAAEAVVWWSALPDADRLPDNGIAEYRNPTITAAAA